MLVAQKWHTSASSWSSLNVHSCYQSDSILSLSHILFRAWLSIRLTRLKLRRFALIFSLVIFNNPCDYILSLHINDLIFLKCYAVKCKLWLEDTFLLRVALLLPLFCGHYPLFVYMKKSEPFWCLVCLQGFHGNGISKMENCCIFFFYWRISLNHLQM